MVQSWKPDTCKCTILYDQEFNFIESAKGKKSIPCVDHAELKGQDIVNFVIAENQSANEFYQKWTNEEIEAHINDIKQYKRVFKEIPDLEPIRNLSYKASIQAFRG